MRREARVLAALEGNRRAASGTDRRLSGPRMVLGAAFYLMQPIEGYNPATRPARAVPELVGPAAPRDGLLPRRRNRPRSARRTIVALGLTGLGKPDNYLERQVGRWKAQLESYAEFPEWTA
jgi:aminoglycoside phosphotransferase (APT) family kinase protein